MDVLTFETCWALNKVIMKQVASSWSLFTQLVYIMFPSAAEIRLFVTSFRSLMRRSESRFHSEPLVQPTTPLHLVVKYGPGRIVYIMFPTAAEIRLFVTFFRSPVRRSQSRVHSEPFVQPTTPLHLVLKYGRVEAGAIYLQKKPKTYMSCTESSLHFM